jgi:hypothetical protein
MMEKKLIEAGIRNLKDFGYPNVTAENILTDMIYSQLFKRMLEQSKEEQSHNQALIDSCVSLLAKIEGGQ